jgi:hypothetical protein
MATHRDLIVQALDAGLTFEVDKRGISLCGEEAVLGRFRRMMAPHQSRIHSDVIIANNVAKVFLSMLMLKVSVARMKQLQIASRNSCRRE